MGRSKNPKRAVDVPNAKIPYTGKSVQSAKKPNIGKDTQAYLKMYPIFSFRKYDAGAPWATRRDGKPTTDGVFKNLGGIEGQRWGEIECACGGRSHGTNSHNIPITDMSKDAQKRANSIGLNETELFSLRLQGVVRLFGVIEPENGCFHVIWFDPAHQVCPTKR